MAPGNASSSSDIAIRTCLLDQTRTINPPSGAILQDVFSHCKGTARKAILRFATLRERLSRYTSPPGVAPSGTDGLHRSSSRHSRIPQADGGLIARVMPETKGADR